MARSSAKHGFQGRVSVAFDGGLNLADNPDQLPDNQLSGVLNMYYEEGLALLSTRPGLLHAAGPVPDGSGILKLHWFERGDLDGVLVAATSGGALCRLDESGPSPRWEHVTDLAQPGLTPSLRTFHGRLVIADGGPCLRAWDGQDTQALEGSPPATALAEIGGRLAANSASDLDGVAFSGPHDETDWDTDQGGAVFLRAGYGEGLRVTGFGVIGQDLVVFKSGDSGKRIMRVQTAGPASQWAVSELSRNLTAHSGHTVEFVGNNLFFAGPGGIMDLAGVQQYGDIQVGGAGRPINPILGGRHVGELRFLPRLEALLAFIQGDSRVLVFHPHNQAWTVIDFQGLFFSTACQAGERVFLAGGNGRLYRLAPGESRDEVREGQFEDIRGLARTRVFPGRDALLLRKTRLSFEALTPGSGRLQALGSDRVSPVTLLSWEANPGLGRLSDAVAPLAGAAQPLGSAAEAQRVSHARLRDSAVSFQITTTSGRIRLRHCQAELAQAAG